MRQLELVVQTYESSVTTRLTIAERSRGSAVVRPTTPRRASTRKNADTMEDPMISEGRV